MENISDLETQLDQAIEDCNFPLAEQIKNKIDQLKKAENDNIANQYIQSFTKLLEECKSNYNDEMKNLEEIINDQEIIIRRKVSNIFHQIQVQHIEVLLQIEKENLLQFAKDRFRSIPEFLEIQEQARIAARNKKFDTATQLKESSEEVQEKELEKREESVKKQYYSRRNIVLNKQKDEIKQLTNQLNNALHNLARKKEFEAEKIYQMYKKNLKESFENVKSFIKTITNPDLRNQCLIECSKIYKNHIKENNSNKSTTKSGNQSSRAQSSASSRIQSQSNSRSQSQASSRLSNYSKDLHNASNSDETSETHNQPNTKSPTKSNRLHTKPGIQYSPSSPKSASSPRSSKLPKQSSSPRSPKRSSFNVPS